VANRSRWKSRRFDTLSIVIQFTVTQRFNVWPQVKLHNQWPGNGSIEDPIFDIFYVSTVPSITLDLESSLKIKQARTALLDVIGQAKDQDRI